jgi:hypothetical protein
MFWLTPIVLTMTVWNWTPTAQFGAAERRIRSTDPRIARLIVEGARRSPTLAELMTLLGASDVIVYVERAHDLPATLDGRLQLLPSASAHRYLRIQVRIDRAPSEVIALIGHELRHAIEIAQAREVRDGTALAMLYERIGMSMPGSHRYDTMAARHTGRRVWAELRG